MKPLLIENELTEAERELLESAGIDEPSRAARAATMTALGLGVAGGVTGVAGAAHAAKGAVAALPAAHAGGTVAAVVVAKWLGVGALAGAVLAGGVSVVTTAVVLSPKRPVVSAGKAAEPPRRVETAGPQPGSPAPAPLRPQGELPSSAEVAPPVREKQGSVALESAPAASPGPSTGSLGAADGTGRVVEEVVSLDRVRAALAVGDAQGALGRLAAHERSFPAGALEPEAVLLRVRALVQLGRLGEARQVARRFLAEHPRSAQAPRLEALIAP